MPAIVFLLFSCCDWLTGSYLTARIPAIMWAVYGLILGGTMAFWLEAPVYGLRKQRPFIVGVPVVLLFIAALSISLKQPTVSLAAPAAPAPAPPLAPNFSGIWDTGQWGTMTMTQDGEHVFGTYTYSNGVLEGTTSPSGAGTSVLNYRWRNQEGNANGVGYFTLAPDANSFAGKYADGEVLNDNGGKDWGGNRTGAGAPPPTFTGDWETEWGHMTLNQGVSRVTGVYRYGGGIIDGQVEGKTLKFRWTNRVTGESGLGQFTLALYGASFEGTWGHGESSVDSGAKWTGKRQP